ncbi:PAS domain-containing sensor histidine kinase [Arcobacter roscoffensis]|uniref:histidine kinase n=1 Tax=Arcobacter roscoffensis TaxID=2961520 RepID=A0ABY5E7A8_9BACT|nr:PAS domain S-box protein [Arcobacter roscoffensis]UTJ07060.1 PAS domain S-box protein [Arcobacter roscoffensis]
MKINFYIKLFFTFILFAAFLLTFSLFSFEKFYKKDIEDKNISTIFSSLQDTQEMFDEYKNTTNRILIDIKKSSALKTYLEDASDKFLKELVLNLKAIKPELHSFRIVDFNANENLKIYFDKYENIKEKTNLNNIKRSELFKEILSSNKNEIYQSSIYLLKKDNEIAFPLVSLQSYIVKVKGFFIILDIDIKKVFEKIQRNSIFYTYVLDEKGNFFLHENSKYNWSKYFIPSYNLKDIYANHREHILNKEDFIYDEFISKRIYISSDKYIIVIVKTNEHFTENSLDAFEDYFNSIVIVGLLLAIVLTLVLTEPIFKLNKNVIEKNKDLNISVQKSYIELNDSLKTIDKHIMSIRLDTNGTITDVSTAFCDVSGFSKGELIGHPHKILIHPDMSNETYDEIWEYIKKGNSYNFELKCMKKDASFFWSESFIEPNYDIQNTLIGFTVIRNNITNKKTIQKLYDDLNIQVNQYNTIFENVNSGIALINIEGSFQKVNKPFSDLLLYNFDELFSMSFFDLIEKDSVEFFEKLFDEALHLGSIKNIEKIFIDKNGEEVHLEISLSVLSDRKHFVLVLNSLEDKRKLQELNQNLEQKIKDEVEKSRQKDKIHQQEQIKNAKLSSIGALAAGITHEINTPLTYIKGNFEMMGYDIEDLPPSEIRERMLEDSVKINDGINRIANIVESMREISQSSNEKKESVNIYSTLITALTMAYNRSKQVCPILINEEEFNLDKIDKNRYVYKSFAQKQRLEQVWIIILNNALDELVKIESYENRLLKINLFEDESHIIVRFIDNAGGINKDIIDNIFQPFISSKEHSGMGVGLNIAKKIIEQQKGEIVAFNKNNGAVFEIKLEKEIG